MHYALSVEKNPKGSYDLELDVVDGKERTASFWQKGLPASIVVGSTAGVLRGLQANFFGNAGEILVKNTYLAAALSKLSGLSYFPRTALEKFLGDALISVPR